MGREDTVENLPEANAVCFKREYVQQCHLTSYGSRGHSSDTVSYIHCEHYLTLLLDRFFSCMDVEVIGECCRVVS